MCERIRAELGKWVAYREPYLVGLLGLLLSALWAGAWAVKFPEQATTEAGRFWGNTIGGFVDYGLICLAFAGALLVLADRAEVGGFGASLVATPGLTRLAAAKWITAVVCGGLLSVGTWLLVVLVSCLGLLSTRTPIVAPDPSQLVRALVAGMLASAAGASLAWLLRFSRKLVLLCVLGWGILLERILGALYFLYAAALGDRAGMFVDVWVTPVRTLAWFVTTRDFGIDRGFDHQFGVLPALAGTVLLTVLALFTVRKIERKEDS